jgi:hypothetical protein
MTIEKEVMDWLILYPKSRNEIEKLNKEFQETRKIVKKLEMKNNG